MAKLPKSNGFQSQRVIVRRRKRGSNSSQNKGKKTSNMEGTKSTAFFVDTKESREDGDQMICSAKNTESHQSLQEAFLSYRKSRHEKMVQAGKAARRKRLKRCDPKRMMALRLKFLEQCKKYIGTPYKRKYHEPGTPAYNSSLFLDCCGLVRRVLQDMKSDFGFDIGHWNQSYMYDTLPTILAREDSMKPGDLVFISGVYFNEKMKPQVHGIVHVEVWLGDGRKTIGARWHKGAVQVFDSYRFKSTSYHSMRYHFKSINPWLMGICKSHCPMHAWRLAKDFRPSKRSVLRLKTNRQQQQQNASDVDQSQNLSKINQETNENNQSDGNVVSQSASVEESDVEQQRSNMSSAGCSQDSQETLMKDILLSGSDMVDALAEKLRILPVNEAGTPPSQKKSLAYIQVTKSITNQKQDDSQATRMRNAPSSGESANGAVVKNEY